MIRKSIFRDSVLSICFRKQNSNNISPSFGNQFSKWEKIRNWLTSNVFLKLVGAPVQSTISKEKLQAASSFRDAFPRGVGPFFFFFFSQGMNFAPPFFVFFLSWCTFPQFIYFHLVQSQCFSPFFSVFFSSDFINYFVSFFFWYWGVYLLFFSIERSWRTRLKVRFTSKYEGYCFWNSNIRVSFFFTEFRIFHLKRVQVTYNV